MPYLQLQIQFEGKGENIEQWAWLSDTSCIAD